MALRTSVGGLGLREHSHASDRMLVADSSGTQESCPSLPPPLRQLVCAVLRRHRPLRERELEPVARRSRLRLADTGLGALGGGRGGRDDDGGCGANDRQDFAE